MIKKSNSKSCFTLTAIFVTALVIGVLMAMPGPAYSKSTLISRAAADINLPQMVSSQQISNMARKGDSAQAAAFAFSVSYAQSDLGCDGSICSSAACNCAGVVCQSGLTLNLADCKCNCTKIKTCLGDSVFDMGKCTCVKQACNITCTGGQMRDDTACICRCPAWQCLNQGVCVDPSSTCTPSQGVQEKICPGGNGVIAMACQPGCPNKLVDSACQCNSGYGWNGTQCVKRICADGSIQKRSCDNDYAKVQTRTFKFLTGWSAWEGCCDCNIDVGPGGGNAGL